jgi:hypothetical protein|tara:strand:+ start:152 stop:340 length:189 start_codon:yes stop_codon:yes gene_type:complete
MRLLAHIANVFLQTKEGGEEKEKERERKKERKKEEHEISFPCSSRLRKKLTLVDHLRRRNLG